MPAGYVLRTDAGETGKSVSTPSKDTARHSSGYASARFGMDADVIGEGPTSATCADDVRSSHAIGYTGTNLVADGYLRFVADGAGDTQV